MDVREVDIREIEKLVSGRKLDSYAVGRFLQRREWMKRQEIVSNPPLILTQTLNCNLTGRCSKENEGSRRHGSRTSPGGKNVSAHRVGISGSAQVHLVGN